ncbi:MAG: serine protease [Pyrinomonadaceae bacterium]
MIDLEIEIALGNPQEMEGIFSNGMISNVAEVDKVSYLQFTAPVSSGSSGGPVVDDRAQVVGIVNMQIAEAQNLNFCCTGLPSRELDNRQD